MLNAAEQNRTPNEKFTLGVPQIQPRSDIDEASTPTAERKGVKAVKGGHRTMHSSFNATTSLTHSSGHGSKPVPSSRYIMITPSTRASFPSMTF